MFNPTWVQQDYQFYKDDGVQGGASTWGAAANSTSTVLIGQNFRLLVNVGDTNNADSNNTTTWQLEYRIDGGTWTAVTGATAVKYVTSAYVSNGNNYTTQRLSAISGSTYTSARNEFIDDNLSTSYAWQDQYCELEFSLQMDSGSFTGGESVEFRLYGVTVATPLTPTNTPTLSAESANQSASPGTGTLRAVGNQPTTYVSKSASPGTGAVVLSGNQPTVEVPAMGGDPAPFPFLGLLLGATSGNVASPGTGTVRAVGNQPTIGQTWSALPIAASILIVGAAPLIGVTHSSNPGSGTARVIGDAPTTLVSTNAYSSPTSGLIRVVGGQPTVYVTTHAYSSPSAGTVRAVGNAPTVGATRSANPSSGTLRAVGNQPDVSLAINAYSSPTVGTVRAVGNQPTTYRTTNTFSSPSEGTVQVVGNQPTTYRTTNAFSSPSVGSVLVSGNQPNVSSGANKAVSPSVGICQIVGQQPTIGQTWSASPSVGSVIFSGNQPNVSAGANKSASPSEGAVTVVGQQPTTGATRSANPASGAVRAAGNQPNVFAGSNKSVGPSVGAVQVVGLTPTVGVTRSAAPLAGTVRAVGNAPTTLASAHVYSSPSVATVRAVGNQPNLLVSAGAEVYPSPGTFFVSGNISDTLVTGGIGRGGDPGPIPSIGMVLGFEAKVPVPAASLALTTYAPLISTSKATSPGVGTLRFVGNAPAPVTSVTVREQMLAVDQPFITVVWDEPTLDIFGAPTTVTGYKVYCGTSPTVLSEYADVAAPTTWALVRLPSSGTWYVRVSAYNSDGESDLSLIETVTVSPQKFAPTIGLAPAVYPSEGALRVSGEQPNVTAGTDIGAAPLRATVRIVGNLPVVGVTQSSSPGAGVVRVTGNIPVQYWEASPSSGTLRAVGKQPVAGVKRSASPSAGALRVVGNQPNVLSDNNEIAFPARGLLRLRGNPPRAVLAAASARPTAGIVALRGDNPRVSTGIAFEGLWFKRLSIYSVISGLGNWFGRNEWATRDTELTTNTWGRRIWFGASELWDGDGTPLAPEPTTTGGGTRGVVDKGGYIEVSAPKATLAGTATLTFAGLGAHPGAGSVVVNGNAPATHVATGKEASPQSGSVVIVGVTAGVSTNRQIYPSEGTVRISGSPPIRMHTADADLSAPSAAVEADGEWTLVPQFIDGDGALTAPKATLAGSVKPGITGYGDLAAPDPTVRVKAWCNLKAQRKGWSKQSTGDETWTVVNNQSEDWTNG